jgi:ribosomal protein L11 methyltransferase
MNLSRLLIHSEMDYIEIRLHTASEEKREILTSSLAEEQFESFAESDDELLAYVQIDKYDAGKVSEICSEFGISFIENRIPEQNWNAEWEKNFEPVLIAEKCFIRAPFHAPHPEYEYEIIIEPKMSFGTAHHETTAMMLETMMQMDFRGKKVLDMGCGTGILAILAAKMGAAKVDAIDNDTWAVNNSIENIERNQVSVVSVRLGDVDKADKNYDIILANINRNILLGHLPEYSKLSPSCELLMSGFYEEDLPVIRQVAESVNFVFRRMLSKNHWVAVLFHK